MFGRKAKRIQALEKSADYWEMQANLANQQKWAAEREADSAKKATLETIAGLVKRLHAAAPYRIGGWVTYRITWTGADGPTKTSEDSTPIGDLQRYVEEKESEKKQNDAQAKYDAEQLEIRLRANEEIEKHVAKLHKKGNK